MCQYVHNVYVGQLTDSALGVLPCTSTSTAKLVKCVASHSTLLPFLMVSTPSSDQEFLSRKIRNFILEYSVTHLSDCQKTHFVRFVML